MSCTQTERLVERLVHHLGEEIDRDLPFSWAGYEELGERIRRTYEVPATSCSSVMSRMLFALGASLNPRSVVAAGSYVGYCISWLLGLADASRQLESAVLIDVDEASNRIAHVNCAHLGYGLRLRVLTGEAQRVPLPSLNAIDLLFIDIDDEHLGKAGYGEILAHFLPRMSDGCFVIAHDPCVPRFRSDFESYHRVIRESGCFEGPWVLPIDPCGLSIAVRRQPEVSR